MELPKQLKDEIWEYCRLNDISAVDDFTIKMIRQGFTSEKFGSTPWNRETEVKEVEKIVEKIVEKEVPVEVIKEVEKVIEKVVEKEVPVEVVKEIEKIVEKEIYVTDDETITKLQKQLDETKEILKDTIEAYDEERKSVSQINKETDGEIERLTKVSDVLNSTIELKQLELDNIKKERDSLLKQLDEETKKNKQLTEELEVEKNKVKKEDDNDIYGEGKRGFFGSNISDLWNKKKQ